MTDGKWPDDLFTGCTALTHWPDLTDDVPPPKRRRSPIRLKHLHRQLELAEIKVEGLKRRIDVLDVSDER